MNPPFATLHKYPPPHTHTQVSSSTSWTQLAQRYLLYALYFTHFTFFTWITLLDLVYLQETKPSMHPSLVWFCYRFLVNITLDDAVMIFFLFAGAINGPASGVVFGQHHAGWGGVCGLYFFPAAPLPPGQTNHGGSGALPWTNEMNISARINKYTN